MFIEEMFGILKPNSGMGMPFMHAGVKPALGFK